MMEPTKKAVTFYKPYIADPPITDPQLFFGHQADIDRHLSTTAHIEAELAELGENITSFQSPQSE
jgi:hypothetical protein